MANSGAHRNGSQFFVCYKSAAHLDGKHSVFGAVVGGMETLAKMERVPTDADDRPPAVGRDRHRVRGGVRGPVRGRRAGRGGGGGEEARGRGEGRARAPGVALNPGRWWSNPAGEAARAADDAPTAKAGRRRGEYISAAPKRRLPDPPTGAAVAKKAKSSGGGYGNFDAW